MNATKDFSRRFFADFIATRIKAWSLEEGGARPSSRTPAEGTAADPAHVETHAADPVDRPRGLLPGMGPSGG
jgi:hypothetical protein